jgi:hypothetical protein
MDYLFEHENDPVPDLSSVTQESSAVNRDAVDAEDEGDLETLAGGADAKVHTVLPLHGKLKHSEARASNVHNVAKYSRTQR